MADGQVATCDGGKFDPFLGYRKEGLDCPTPPLVLEGENDTEIQLNAQGSGWVRRYFRGPGFNDNPRWWSFCPEHVMGAIEQYFLARFSDDGE